MRSSELRSAASSVWDAAVTHPFVRGLEDGSLDEAAFAFYIRQDYLFLIDYGRLLSLGAARAPRLEWMRRFAGLARRCSRPRWPCTASSPPAGA